MKTSNRATGDRGEQLAVQELQCKGYTILETNWGNKWGEIDIIARHNQVLIFVEVKTKIGDHFGAPEEMINKAKLAKIRRMAQIYCLTNNLTDPMRLDMLALVLDREGGVVRLTHYENVY